MKFFITTDNGHIEDILGDRITFNSIEVAETYIKTNNSVWTDEPQTYYIGTDDGTTWDTVKTVEL